MTSSMTHPPHLRLLATGAAVLFTAVLGACASDEKTSTGSGSGATTTTAPGAPVATNTVEVKDFTFTPGPIKVAVGTTVTWTNKDGFDHTVTAEDDSFDSKALASNQPFEHTFGTAGTFAYICNIHNSMTGSVTVG